MIEAQSTERDNDPSKTISATAGSDFRASHLNMLKKLRRTNLNLLPVLSAVLATGKIGEAARQLNLTQPAVSQALRQLRTIFDDELVVMAGRRPTVTARGLALAGALRKLLEAADQLLHGDARFDPAADVMTARIVTADYITAALTPYLLETCSQFTPAHRIDFVGIDIMKMQDLSQMDLVILPRQLAQHLGKTNGSLPLFEDRFVCIASADSAFPMSLAPADIRALPQLKFSLDAHFPSNTHHLLTAAADLENDDAWTFESYTALASIACVSTRIAIVPEMLAKWIGRMMPFKTIEIDGPPRTYAIDAIWGLEFESLPDHKWLRTIVRDAALQSTAHLHSGPDFP